MDEMSFKKELLELTRDINMKFTTLLSDFYQPLGITAVQALILSELCEHGEKKISDLGKNLNMTNSNVSVICQRLEKWLFKSHKRYRRPTNCKSKSYK